MNYRHTMALAALLALGGALRADDTVVLKDGTVVTGQVMQETQDQVVVQDNGVQRSFDRGLVSKVEFDTSPNSAASSPDQAAPAPGPDASASQPGDTVPSAPGPDASQGAAYQDSSSSAPAGDAVPSPPNEDQEDYAAGVSGYYQVPQDEVWGYEQQGIPYEELPVLFYIARRAACAPGLVASLRLSGMSWADICMHFGLGPGIFYWNGLFGRNWGGPYSGIYLGFHRYPHRFWTWSTLNWSDGDIINCVNLRFETGWWHLRPFDVVRWRGLGHPFFWGGYGYRHAAFHRPGVAARGGWARARVGAQRYRVGRNGAGRQGAWRNGAGRQGAWRNGANRHNGGGHQGADRHEDADRHDGGGGDHNHN